jgi:hypothetical protein
MAHKGKIQLTFVIAAPPHLAEEGDRLFRSHAPWMEAELQRVQGAGAFQPHGSQLCPDREYLLHPE